MIPPPAGWTHFEQVASTNDTIHEAAIQGAAEGTVHLARAQTAGRGRLGRSWWAPPDACLLVSTLLRPRLEPSRTIGVSLVAGAAAKAALDPQLERPLSLYWPNDLYADRHRKVGGILCELRSQSSDNYWIALGMGVNVDLRNADIPEELQGQVACLAELGCPIDRPSEIARAILDAFWRLYDRFQDGEPLGALVDASLAHVGGRVTVRDPHRPTLRGTVVGLGDQGELLLRDERGARHEVIAGDVFYE